MNKKMLAGLFILISIFLITGCMNNNNSSVSGTKAYSCTNNDSSDEKRYLTSYTIELNSKGQAVKYKIKDGFGNYGKNTYAFNDYCNNLKESMEKNKSKLEQYKDASTYEVICDDEKMEVYYVVTYDLEKIKDIADFININNVINKYTKDNGKFDLEMWKEYFNTNELKAGHYDCDF